MHKAILAVALSLKTKNNAICAVSLVRGFCRKKCFEPPLQHLKQLPWKRKRVMLFSFRQAFRKPNCRRLVQEEHGFQKGAQCDPWPQQLKKAWPG